MFQAFFNKIRHLSKYAKIEIIELQDYDFGNAEVNMQKEKELIIKNLSPKDYVITLEIKGKQLSSEEFADKIDTIFISNPNITFIIGGSYGLHDEIKTRSNFALSF